MAGTCAKLVGHPMNFVLVRVRITVMLGFGLVLSVAYIAHSVALCKPV